MEAALKINFLESIYNPDTGRFLSEDPTGFYGGDVNLYRYVRDNPTNYIDPFGRRYWFGFIQRAKQAILFSLTLCTRAGVKGNYVELCCIAAGITCNHRPKDPPIEKPPCDPSKQSCFNPPPSLPQIPPLPKESKESMCGAI